ncbi:purple acid phosphatase 17, partial [Haematococcus lacustris]
MPCIVNCTVGMVGPALLCPSSDPQNTPAALTAQLQYIEWALSTSTADWTIVVGHHPVVGGAATVYGFNASR